MGFIHLLLLRSGPRTGGLRLLCLQENRLKCSLHPSLLEFLTKHGVVLSGSDSLEGKGQKGDDALKKKRAASNRTVEQQAAAAAAAEAENATLHGLLGGKSFRDCTSVIIFANKLIYFPAP